MWPLGWGFERYYGFLRRRHQPMGARAGRRTTTTSIRRRTYDDGYHLSEDLADRVIRNIRDQKQATPASRSSPTSRSGAMHAPHHVAREWVSPYRGRFDAGWEFAREP